MTDTDDNIVHLPDDETLALEAASWLTVLGRDHVSDEEFAKFNAWLRQSDRHQQAFDRFSALSAEMPLLKELDDIAEATIQEVPPPILPFAPVLGRRQVMGIAASLVAITAVGTSVHLLQNRALTEELTLATTMGQQRTLTLSDGSTVQLNTDSEVAVAFTRQERTLRLIRGEAHFDVAPNTRRPFKVYAADGLVQAVGTAFTVRLRPDRLVEVTVEEGRVALAALSPPATDTPAPAPAVPPTAPPTEALAQLTAGQTAGFRDQVEHLAQMPAPALKRKLAWRQGVLAYAGEPLADVIADIGRYTDLRIDAPDPAVRARPVAGYLPIKDVETSFESLVINFGLKVEWIAENHVVLTEAM